jgi:hypothetical protein
LIEVERREFAGGVDQSDKAIVDRAAAAAAAECGQGRDPGQNQSDLFAHGVSL